MQKQNIAVLLTCHNRRAKTVACLESLYRANVPAGSCLHIYLTDDGSTDGTGEAVKARFPCVNIIQGDGNLFWAGGMRLAWKTAINVMSYDAYLLINDDVFLYPGFISNLLEADAFSVSATGQRGIYAGATVDQTTGQVTYGGSRIVQNHLFVSMRKLTPASFPLRCDLTNANILWISRCVVDKIGVFSERYTHGIADYDYARRAVKKKIPVWLAPNLCGLCSHDHGKNWKTGISLKERIAWMKSPKGLAYGEYMYYIRKHFPACLPYSFIMIWMKVLFPVLWERLKK